MFVHLIAQTGLSAACVLDCTSDVTAADAEKKDPEQFEIWRKDPANFSFDGRYPLFEVYDKAKEAWKGVSALHNFHL